MVIRMGEQLQPEEQKEQQEQQKKNGIMQNIKNNVKEQAKQQAKTQAKQAGLKVTKKVAIKVVSLLFLKPPVCIVTWVIILMIVLSMLLHSVWDAVGDKVNEVVDSITDFFEVDYEFQAGLITISQDEIDKVIKGIQDLGVDIDGLKLMGDPDKVDYSDPDVQEQNKIRLRYYIKRFFEAQAMTQTINTNPNIIEKLLASDPYGSVYVYRPKDNLKDGDPLTKDNIEKMK